MAKFKVERQYIMIGSDFSQQEPKITADLSNDEQFIKDCASGKDAYATIASIAFEKPYEECMEFYLDENGKKTNRTNKEGKERRSMAKIILLGKLGLFWPLNLCSLIKRFIGANYVNPITQGCILYGC